MGWETSLTPFFGWRDPGHAALAFLREPVFRFVQPFDVIVNVIAYVLAQTLEQVLKKCGDNLTHDNIMRTATTLGVFTPPRLIPGVRIEPSPKDYLVVRDLRLDQFDGEKYTPIGPAMEMKLSR